MKMSSNEAGAFSGILVQYRVTKLLSFHMLYYVASIPIVHLSHKQPTAFKYISQTDE